MFGNESVTHRKKDRGTGRPKFTFSEISRQKKLSKVKKISRQSIGRFFLIQVNVIDIFSYMSKRPFGNKKRNHSSNFLIEHLPHIFQEIVIIILNN